MLNDGERRKLNDGADAFFYNYPRICYHVDQGFLTHLTELYRWDWGGLPSCFDKWARQWQPSKHVVWLFLAADALSVVRCCAVLLYAVL